MPSKPTTCSQLAAMVVAVRDTDHGSPECERAILNLRDDDLATVEVVCRLLPAETVVALERAGDQPLWSDRSPCPVRDLADLLRPALVEGGTRPDLPPPLTTDPVLRAADLAIQALDLTVRACALAPDDGQERVVQVARTTQRVMTMWSTVLSRAEAAIAPLRDEAQGRCLHLGRRPTHCPTCGKSF